MIKFWKLLIYFKLFFCLLGTVYGRGTRWVNMNWAEIEGAVSYELELFFLEGKEYVFRGSFKIKKTQWSFDLIPGLYRYRVRSIDARDVPGIWSAWGRFKVRLPEPEPVRPYKNEAISSDIGVGKKLVLFQWKPVDGAIKYYLEVWYDKGKTIIKKYLTINRFESTLRVGRSYYWRVVALARHKEKIPPRNNDWNFIIEGSALPIPESNVRENAKSVILFWERPEKNNLFKVSLLRKEGVYWKQVFSRDNFKKNKISVSKRRLKRGEYQFLVSAKGKGRKDSGDSITKFAWNGRKIIRLYSGTESVVKGDATWPVLATFDFFQQEYKGIVQETNSQVAASLNSVRFHVDIGKYLTSLGGSLGTILQYETYKYSKKSLSVWMAAFYFRKKLVTFLNRFSTYYKVGLFLKSSPFLMNEESDYIQEEELRTYGLYLGLEEDIALFQKFFLNISMDIFWHGFSMQTPNDKKLQSSSLTTTAGVLFKYRYDQLISAVFGVSYMSQEMAFEADQSTSNPHFAGGDLNDITLEGLIYRFGFEIIF